MPVLTVCHGVSEGGGKKRAAPAEKGAGAVAVLLRPQLPAQRLLPAPLRSHQPCQVGRVHGQITQHGGKFVAAKRSKHGNY